MKRFKRILFVVDPKRTCKLAFERAIVLAENNQASLTIVDTVPRLATGISIPGGGAASDDLQATLLASHAKRLEALIEPYSQRIDMQVKVLVGTPFLEVIREVLRNRHELVIKPPEDPGWLDRLFGSDDMNLLRKCPCPVWLLKCKGPRAFRRILAAVDVDDSYPPEERGVRHAMNCLILEMSGTLALSEFAELHIAHVWDSIGEMVYRGALLSPPQEQLAAYLTLVKQRAAENLRTLMRELTNTLGEDALDYLKPKIHLEKGWARKKIPAMASRLGIDLVVMGTVGRTGVPGLVMGNTAEAILQQVDCSVLALKPPGFVTPVGLGDAD